MPNIVPGVVWQPVDVGNRARRIKGRGLCGHVAVSSSKNLAPGPLATRASDWHFYLPKSGPAIQYIDLDLQCWATGAGNSTMAAFESEGGLGTEAQVNAEPWTDNQLNWAARILRHMHDTEGVPLRVMASSESSERGFGTHRLGVPGYMTTGEVWSSSRGKSCPGTAKHDQRFEIVRRAADGASLEDDVNLSDPLSWTRPDTGKTVTFSVADWIAYTNYYTGQAVSQIADLTAKVDALTAKLGSATPAGSKLPTEFDLSSIARAVADELDRRDRDNDPDTGRSS